MRKRRILVLVVILIILNVAIANEEDESNVVNNENDNQNDTPNYEDGASNADRIIQHNIVTSQYRHGYDVHPPQVVHPSNKDIADGFKNDAKCKCNDGLDCKCANTTEGNIHCHCGDFDNLAKINEGFSCKCEKNVTDAIQLKCQCARKDSNIVIRKTVTCTSTATFTQSHVRDISFGIGGRLALYEKDDREKKVEMVGIKDINDILEIMNQTKIQHNYTEIIINLMDLVEIDVQILLQRFLTNIEFQLQHFNLCGCRNDTSSVICNCNDDIQLYTPEHPSQCLCIPKRNDPSEVQCMCNEHVKKPKLLYSPSVFDIFRCDCSKAAKSDELICECREKGALLYNYERIIIDIRKVTERHTESILRQLKDYVEFNSVEFQFCVCEKNGPSWGCTCGEQTGDFNSQTSLTSCLCANSDDGSRNNCLCSNDILKPTVLFNSKDVSLYGCYCYNTDSVRNATLLKCDCKKRENKENKYNEVVLDIREIDNANARDVITELNYTAQYYQKNIDYCDCQYEDSLLVCNCTYPASLYTKESPNPCICVINKANQVNCLCKETLHNINIIYQNDILVQDCYCSQFLTSDETVECKCNDKHSYLYDYKNVMIDIVPWNEFTLATILSHLVHTVEYRRERFNLCRCSGSQNDKRICSCHDKTKSHQITSCFCTDDKQYKKYKFCMCNLHFISNEAFEIRYSQTEDRYIEHCTCEKDENEKGLICRDCKIKQSVHRFSDNPYNGTIVIPITTENQLNVIINLVFKNYQTQDRHINKCQCNEYMKDCTCEHNIKHFQSSSGILHCLCVTDYYYTERPIRCACNPRALDRVVDFTPKVHDIRSCNIYDTNHTYCELQVPAEPNYNLISITTTDVVYTSRLKEYIIKSAPIFKDQKFNICNCKNFDNKLDCKCTKNTEVYTESNRASCQCIDYGEEKGFQCICSPQILQIDIYFHAHPFNIRGCRCYHKEDTGETKLICDQCIARTPIGEHPKWPDRFYKDKHVVIPNDVENQLDVIISFILKEFHPVDRTINHCECTNNFQDCKCKYKPSNYIMRDGKLHCLCVVDFYFNKKPMQCACNPHILEPHLEYKKIKYDIRKVHCGEEAGNKINSIICNPSPEGGSISHAADRVVINIKDDLIITIKHIFEYIIQQQDYKNEQFTSCNCTKDEKLTCDCERDTSRFDINHQRNCFCVKPTDDSKNVDCLCNSIVLQFGIIFNPKFNIEACRCYHSIHSSNNNQLICESCVHRTTYEQNPHFTFDRTYTETVVIEPKTDNQLSIIIAHVVKQFNINDRVVNYCRCKEDLTDCSCEYPIYPYLTLNRIMNCFCVADYYYIDHPIRCGCNPYVFQPNVVYNKMKYDFRFIECEYHDTILTCRQTNNQKQPDLVNKIVIEVTESRLIEISILVNYILSHKGYDGDHINICRCDKTSEEHMFCTCTQSTKELTITNTGSCLYTEFSDSKNKWNTICNPRILQVGLIFNSKLHLDGCRCFKTIDGDSKSLTCAQCENRITFEENPRFDHSLDYTKVVVHITESIENQLIVIINYIFNYIKFPVENRVVNYCSCTDNLNSCKCDRPILPYATLEHKLRCLCVADYFYNDHPIRCACNPFVSQLQIIRSNVNIFDLRYIICNVNGETDKGNFNDCKYEGTQPNADDKVVVRVKKEIVINIVIIMEFILRRQEYINEQFNFCKCSVRNDGYYSCSCDRAVDVCKKESKCSCLCVIPSANSPNEIMECMCNPRVLQFGIQFNFEINRLEGCRCYKDDKDNSIICDDCLTRLPFDQQTRFNYVKNYTNYVIRIPQDTENQIDIIYRIIVEQFDISDRFVDFCSCSENYMDCTCEYKINQYITRDSELSCFCVADYYYTEHPIRCACNPLIVQPHLIYNNQKFDFRYLKCFAADLNGYAIKCELVPKTQNPDPGDRAVVVVKSPLKLHFEDIREYVVIYPIYNDEDFKFCSCHNENSKILCNCDKITTNYNITEMGSCLCVSNPSSSTPECMCGPHILQIGIIYQDINVQACRCYHSIQNETSLKSLVCQHCNNRPSFEYNPRFKFIDTKYIKITVQIDDFVQNQIEYIYNIIVRNFIREDRISNFCECLPDLKTCKCKYSIEPYLVDKKLSCFCISDYYHVEYPYQCACNPFILQPSFVYDKRKFEFRYLDCISKENSRKDIICTERSTSPPPPSAEYKLVLRLRNVAISMRIIIQYLLQTKIYNNEPLISCNCNLEQDKYSCTCLNNTSAFNIHNKAYCLCITNQGTNCLCNSRILQFGIVFQSNTTIFNGCQCYSKYKSNDENSLICTNCIQKKSFEFNPHFDISRSYTGLTIEIPRFTEHQINAIIEIIYRKFNSSDGFANHCECTENMEHCKCDYPTPAYIQKNGKMACICVTDYFYFTHPLRCACNPFMIQPEYEYDSSKYDIRLAECTNIVRGSLTEVSCVHVKAKPPVPTMVLDTTVWIEVQIKIIEEHILSYSQYKDEKFNPCTCFWKEENNEYSCDCSIDTDQYTIINMCSCLCVGSVNNRETLSCSCNPRILQIGYRYNSSVNIFNGCRCYHVPGSDTTKSLICRDCEVIPSYEQDPHFNTEFVYTNLTINITNILIQNRIESFIPVIVNQIPEVSNRLVNYCYCKDDYTDCTCQYPIPPYYTKEELMTCLCITDYYYPEYNVRCGCNPFILQPNFVYDETRYHVVRLQCQSKDNVLKMENCIQYSLPSASSMDQIVVDVTVIRQVTIETIITYIKYHTVYKKDEFNTCDTCYREKDSGTIICTCGGPTAVCTVRDTCNCLCIVHNDNPDKIECMCNPLSLQFGVIFNHTEFYLEACRMYHPSRETRPNVLHSHECMRRTSYDVNPHFNRDFIYNITETLEINITTENQLNFIIDVIRKRLYIRDRIFNKCQCTENLSECTCKHEIHPYIQKNNKMACFCVADYFYSDLPIQCACNPFMLQVTLTHLKYSKERYDFRWLECINNRQSVSCGLVKHETTGIISADKVVFDMTRLVKININIILEHIISYPQYYKEKFNQCKCILINNYYSCKCSEAVIEHDIEKRCSCLCYEFNSDSKITCSCNPHILQIGIIFNTSIVEITACRCYHQHKDSEILLTCDDCKKRDSYEVNPRFDLSKQHNYEVVIRNEVQNILVNIITIITGGMIFNDRLVNYCDCDETAQHCRCSLRIEPFIRDVANTMQCFCMSDYYYTSYPIRCACNPFIQQPKIDYNSRIFDFRIGNCTAYLGNKEDVSCKLVSLGKKTPYPEYKYVIKIRDWNIINIGIIKEFLIKSLEFKFEEFNDCTCNNKQHCKCNQYTDFYNVTNRANCLCQFLSNSMDCLCNPRILQIGIVYNPEKITLKGCRCYHVKGSEKYELFCDECEKRDSFERNPRFDLSITYYGKKVEILSNVENQIDVIFAIIIKKLAVQHQIVNHCECSGNLLDCKCDYPALPYSQINRTMPCFCVADYYYSEHPVRCRCNPYILQLKIDYDRVKYDIIYADCVSHNEDNNHVSCTVRPNEYPEVSTDQVVFDMTSIVIIHIKIIIEYIFTFPQFHGEQFNTCNCEIHGIDGLKCNCEKDTSQLQIHNMRSCLCFTQYTNGRPHLPECICNAHILQVGIIFNKDVITWQGCRCYNTGTGSKSLICIECKNIEPLNNAPRFKIRETNYTLIEEHVLVPDFTENQLIIIRQYIIKIFHKNDRFTNECYCTEDFKNCECRNIIEYYLQVNNKMPCFCVADYYYTDRPMRCDCNPFILQLKYNYSSSRFDFKYVECVGEHSGNVVNCEVHKSLITQHRTPADLVVFDLSHLTVIDIKYIKEYIWHFPQYHDNINTCKCLKHNNELNCDCDGDTTEYTIQKTKSCLCFMSSNITQCLCNPRILQLGIIFEKEINSISGCRCYHSIGYPDYQESSTSLVCHLHDCIPRISFDHRPRFDKEQKFYYNVTLPSETQNILINILEVILNDITFNNKLVDYCSCTEDLKDCSCKYPVGPYTVNNVLNCYCVADYYYNAKPIRCGCNPFVLQPNVQYNKKLYDIRHLHCRQNTDDNNLRVICDITDSSPPPHEPQYKQVIRLRNIERITINDIVTRIISNDILRKESLILCECQFINKIQNCTCKGDTTQLTIQHQGDCLCVYNGNNVECICSPRILQIGLIFDKSEITTIKGCRCYHYSKDQHTGSIICHDCEERYTFEMNPRFDKTTNYTGKEVIIPKDVTLDLNVIYIYIINVFEERDRIVNHCECHSDYKNCRCDYLIEPYTRDSDNKMPCVCFRDDIDGLYDIDCVCNPFMMQPTLKFNNISITHALCSSINGNKNNVNCERIEIELPYIPQPPVVIHPNSTAKDIVHQLNDTYILCNCEKKEDNIENGLNCHTCIDGPKVYSIDKDTMCVCIYPYGNTNSSTLECMCNSHAARLQLLYNHHQNSIVTCECSYTTHNQLVSCKKCIPKPSADENPQFSSHNYTGVIINIPLYVGVNIYNIQRTITPHFNGSDGFVNKCECENDFTNCECSKNLDSFSRDGKLYCICVDDYYDFPKTKQCLCNPYMWQPTYEYNKTKLHITYLQCMSLLKDEINCVPKETQRSSVILYDAKKYVEINMSILIKYLLTYTQYYDEDLILCDCKFDPDDNTYICKKCSSDLTLYTASNRIYCLCRIPEDSEKTQKCLCNPFALQSEYIFNSEINQLTGCSCYQRNNQLLCKECKDRESYEKHPRFDITKKKYTEYFVTLADTTENEIGIYLNFLVNKFDIEDKVVNYCQCTEDSKSCICESPVKPYLFEDKMDCFCISDYYYNEYPVRCVCNPFIFQPGLIFNNQIQDVRKSYCKENDSDTVTCNVFTESEATIFSINVRTLRLVTVGIIQEYLYKSKEFKKEPLYSCDCEFKTDDTENEYFDCNSCSKSTKIYTKHSRGNCLCMMPVHETSHPRVECLCGPHILQLGIIYNTKLTDLRGCRCYGGDEDRDLICTDCLKRVSFEKKPHFELDVSYTHKVVNIEEKEEIEINNILSIITKVFNKDQHKILNLCECTEDYSSCRCDYPTEPYSVKDILNCLCILDHYYIDYPVRCGCNPYILQPQLKYNEDKQFLRFAECVNLHNDKDNISCILTGKNLNTHLPRPVVVNLRGTMKIHIITILEYIFSYVEYQGEKFNLCECNQDRSDLSCGCKNDIEINDKTIFHNCLCLIQNSNKASCLCNPHVNQFGIVFTTKTTTLESCRCYHPSLSANASSLICHDRHSRTSISKYIHFDLTHNYTDKWVPSIYNMEVHIESIIEMFVHEFISYDQVVNYCKCKENSENCICDYPVTRYLINNELNCVCIDDFFETIYPVRCGCNPFITQPKSSYFMSKSRNETNYFNFRQFKCMLTGENEYTVKCKVHENDRPLTPSLVSLHHLQYIDIKNILTYFQMKRKEIYNLCNCKYDTNGVLNCKDCSHKTTQCSIKNPCNCFCINDDNPKCLCNPRVLQFSLQFKLNVEFLGCRCYHSIFDKHSDNTLMCTECQKRVSIERAPRFDIHLSYINEIISIPSTLDRRIDSLTALIISRFLDIYQIVLNCLCTKEAEPNCKCDYPFSLYAFDNVLNCICMDDNTNKDYGLRCSCNPYILQPSLQLSDWHVDVTRLKCTSDKIDNTNVHCKANKVPPYDVLIKIPSLSVIHIDILIEYLQRKDVFKNEPFTMCNCQKTKYKNLDCNCQNNTKDYTEKNMYNCLCVHNLKSSFYKVVECLCNAHIHQPRFTYDTNVMLLDKCSCYNDGRYDSFLTCACHKAESYKIMYHNNYGHVTVDVPNVGNETSTEERLEHVRNVIIQKFAPEDQDYSHCRCKEDMEQCTCVKSIQEYSYKTVTPCVCMPDHLNKTYPLACVCNRHVQQPKLRFDSGMFDLRDCDCFEHHGDMTNVSCHCNKKISYEAIDTHHNYSSALVEIPSNTQKRIEYVAQIILKTFKKEDQNHNECFCNKELNICKCIDPILSYYYYAALPCFCMDEGLLDYPIRCMCNRYILEPIIKYDSKVFEFKDCYFMLQHGETIYPRCVNTTNPRTKPEFLKELNYFKDVNLQTKHTVVERKVYKNSTTIVTHSNGTVIHKVVKVSSEP